MDLSNIIALIFGVVGAVLGGVGLYFSHRSAKAAEISAAASEVAAAAATVSAELQRTAWLEEKRARLVWADWQFRFEYEEKELTQAVITIGLRNEGRAPAYGTTMGLFLHASKRYTFSSNSFSAYDDVENKYRREYTSNIIPPGSVHLFRQEIRQADFGESTRRHVTFRIHYRDGIGEHWHNIKLWIGGEWGPAWQKSRGLTHSVISECRDGELSINERGAADLAVPGEAELSCPEFTPTASESTQ